MKLKISSSEFNKSRKFYEFLHRIIVPHISHSKDGVLVNQMLEKYKGGDNKRYYENPIMLLYRILTRENFKTGFPLIQAYNPAVRLNANKLEMLIRFGSINPGRTFIGRALIEDLGQKLINEKSLIPEKRYKAELFIRSKFSYESIEDPRFSPVDDTIFFVEVLRGPGFPIQDVVVTWMFKNDSIAPIMYEDCILSDNRDSFSVTPRITAIRPYYKPARRSVIAFGIPEKNEPNVIRDVFSHEFLLPNELEEKTGGSSSVKINDNEFLFIFHSIYKGLEGIDQKGTTGIYINYGIIMDRYGEVKALLRHPLTPMDYPYSGQRPGTVFATGAIILKGPLIDKLLPGVNNFVKDFDRLLVLFAGLDDESIAVFVQDLDKVLEKMEWL